MVVCFCPGCPNGTIEHYYETKTRQGFHRHIAASSICKAYLIANPRDLSDEESIGNDDDDSSNGGSEEDVRNNYRVEMVNQSLRGREVIHENSDGGSDAASYQSFVSSVYDEDEYNRWGRDSEDEFDEEGSDGYEEDNDDDDDDDDEE